MEPFKVLYYPNSECIPITLAKAILVFDEITFFDHPSLTFTSSGTIGHDSAMRGVAPRLKKEGFQVNVIKPVDGPVENELEKIIDIDLGNNEFRKVFFQLIKNDPSFLVSKVPKGNYGKYGDAENLRKLIQSVPDKDVPRTVSQIRSFKPDGFLPPEILIAITMSSDSFHFNFSTYLAIENNLQLFGDSKGMDMLLNTKFSTSTNDTSTSVNASHKMAFTLLESLVPNERFSGKSIVDIVHFRNKMSKDREKFNERILEATSDLNDLSDKGEFKKFNIILHKHLLPEAREYQNIMAETWDNFFKESTKAVLSGSGQITQIIVTALAVSLATGLLAGATQIGVKVLPHLIDYLKKKESLNRRNPFAYLMKFK